MPQETDSRPKPKHRKSTCSGCRRRKSKCDGKTPKCTTCVAYKDDCQYDKPPSLAYVRSLEEELQDLKSQLRHIKTQSWLARNGANDDQSRTSHSPPSEQAMSNHSNNPVALSHRHRQVRWETDLSIDDFGGVAFHNSTSAVHENGAQVPFSQDSNASSSLSTQDEQRIRRKLMLNANHQRQIEPFAIANSALRINLPKEVSMELMNYHWCWVHPLFLFVYRPAFTKGMAMINYDDFDAPDPPYLSEALLKVVHAHAARFLNHDVYERDYKSSINSQTPVTTTTSAQDFAQGLVEEARYSVGIDMLKSSSIPTIQALLQQSAKEVVSGHASQAWTFAGVAFRMAVDLGIHLPSDKLQSFMKDLTPEDIEIRKRLFWSCYTWDKVLSLYLGRMPGFNYTSTDDIPPSFMDEYSDSDLWVPYYGETPKPDHADASKYPPCPGYVISCFRQLCKLCIILNDLMQDIYSPESSALREEEQNVFDSNAATDGSFVRISRDLEAWFLSLPSHLRVEPDRMPQLAPPVHIMSLNLLYHTTVILLHRPMVLRGRDTDRAGPYRSYQNCLQATAAIHDLLMLQSNTFGLSHVSYLNAYSAYIAATIAVMHFEQEYRAGGDHSILIRKLGLFFLLEVLDRSATSMPILERSSAIIRKRMRRIVDQQMSYVNSDVNLVTTAPFQPTSYHTAISSCSQQSVTGGHVAPMPWQSDLQTSLYLEHSSMVGEYLPAYSSQRFPTESENNFDQGEVNSQMRSSIPEYSLDSSTKINVGNFDWQMLNSFARSPTAVYSSG